MIAIFLYYSICGAVHTDGCTNCSEISGAREVFGEGTTRCVCQNDAYMIYLVNDTLACAELPPWTIIADDFTYTNSPCTRDLTYYEPKSKFCLTCKEPYYHIAGDVLCVNQDGISYVYNDPICEPGFETVREGDDHHFAGCRKCQNGDYSLLAANSADYICGRCNYGYFKDGQQCKDIVNSTCKAYYSQLFVGFESCHCPDFLLPLYSLIDKTMVCNGACTGKRSPYRAGGIPVEVCHTDGMTLWNATCAEETPLDELTGLCACPPGSATVVFNNSAVATCAAVFVTSQEISDCNASALLYIKNKTMDQMFCTQNSHLEEVTTVYTICTQVNAHECTKCEDIQNAAFFTTENGVRCHCKQDTELFTIKDGKIACAEMPYGFYTTNYFNYVHHECDLSQQKYFDVNAKRCMLCDEPFYRRTSNGLCLENEGAYWVGNFSRCYLGYKESAARLTGLQGCEKCATDEYSIDINYHQSCGTCSKNSYRVGTTCTEYTDETCKMFEKSMIAGFRRCRCDAGYLPLHSLKVKLFTCNQSCVGDKTIFNGAGIPSYLCHEKGKTIMNTTCEGELNETTGLCICPQGYATTIKKLTDGTLSKISRCAEVLLDSFHIRQCNKDALFYYETANTAGILYCAQTGDLSIYYHHYDICNTVATAWCTYCNSISGTVSYFAENQLVCECEAKDQQIYIVDGELACANVEKGYYINDTTFNPLATNCSDDYYYDPLLSSCCACDLPFQTKASNGLCRSTQGIMWYGGKAHCMYGFSDVYTGQQLSGCSKCPDGYHSIMTPQGYICGTCHPFEIRYQSKCVDFSEETCKAAGLSPSYSKCVCPAGLLPIHELETQNFTCKRYCGEDTVQTIYTAAGMPSIVCRKAGYTIMNTTCPDAYPLDNETGLCSCPKNFATVTRRLVTGEIMSQSTCAPILLDSFHTSHCNEHALFIYGKGDLELLLCAYHGDISVYTNYYSICDVVDTVICTPCSDVPGTHTVYTENKQFCYCGDANQQIQVVNAKLKCEAVPSGFIVDSHFNVIDNPCDNDGDLMYWDFKNKNCSACNRTYQQILPNRVCNSPDGYLELSVYKRCYLGYEDIIENGALAGCRKCPTDYYSIQKEHEVVCGTCGKREFRQNAHCMNFDADCKNMDINKSMMASKGRDQCYCPSGKLPLFSLKTQLYVCSECSEQSVYIDFNGNGIPAHLCHQPNRTVLNTTCTYTAPLNESTGLCSCPKGQATVVNVLQNGTVTEYSYCADVLLDSYHIYHCDPGKLFVLEQKTEKMMFCLTSGDPSVFIEDGKDYEDDGGLSIGAIIGIAVAAAVVLAAALFTLYWFVIRKRSKTTTVPATNVKDGINQQLI